MKWQVEKYKEQEEVKQGNNISTFKGPLQASPLKQVSGKHWMSAGELTNGNNVSLVSKLATVDKIC